MGGMSYNIGIQMSALVFPHSGEELHDALLWLVKQYETYGIVKWTHWLRSLQMIMIRNRDMWVPIFVFL